MTAPKFYGVTEIADAVGIPTSVLYVWKNRGKLPAPDAVLAMGPVWTARTIEPWIRRERREAPTR